MEKDWGITELTEMFRDEMESMGLLEPEHPDDLFVVDDERLCSIHILHIQ